MMNLKHPLIGITSYGRDTDKRFSLPAVYVDAVRRAGGIPVIIPPGEQQLSELLSRLNGLVLSGGGDINPDIYGGERHETIYGVDAERDRMELALAQIAANWEIPTLCICRGIQTLNVALGGTLIEHLPDIVGEAVVHRVPIDPETRKPLAEPVRHPIIFEPGARLAEIVAQAEALPVSWHHQAVGQVAPGLRVIARAADNTVEAVEMPGHPWLVGVQWHPEVTAADDPSQQRIFDEFVKMAAQHALIAQPAGKALEPAR